MSIYSAIKSMCGAVFQRAPKDPVLRIRASDDVRSGEAVIARDLDGGEVYLVSHADAHLLRLRFRAGVEVKT